mmetsp:Transcript_32315/g.36772  ORF Transcript_32315/g.36772 Transcript_32315/m.36772 type:complete len:399 (-) Transcript_32315:251-1447(-)
MGNVFCNPSSESSPPASSSSCFCPVKKDDDNKSRGLLDFDDDLDDFKTVHSKYYWEEEGNEDGGDADDTMWHSTAMENDWETGDEDFHVTDEELLTLKQHLRDNFAEDSPEEYMSDAYLESVASKPYSKKPEIRRPLEYTMKKLTDVMKWRREQMAFEIPNWIELATKSRNGENPDPQNVSEGKWKTIRTLVSVLNTGSTYVHGHTKEGRPVLWIRTCRKQWYADADAEATLLILVLDAAVRCGMPRGITDFCIISHSYKPPPPNPKALYKMLNGLVKGYPDRMRVLISAPVSKVVQFVMGLLLPLMPGRLAEKFQFLSVDTVNEQLEELLLNGKDDIPTFFGGISKKHEQYYPGEEAVKSKKGILEFDYYGMVERLKNDSDAFQKRKPHVAFYLQQQ